MSAKVAEVLIGFELGDEHVASLVERYPQLFFHYAPCHSIHDAERQLGQAAILFGYHIPTDLTAFPHLRWIQLTGAGFDHLKLEPMRAQGITVTNAPLFAIPIAEYVLSAMLSLSRRLPEFAAELRTNRIWPTNYWVSHSGNELYGQTLGIIGYGQIGQAVAKLAQALGMPVIATRRTARTESIVDGVRIVPVTQLAELLGASDFVLLSLPLTPESRHLMGDEQFRQMKSGASLINVARGAVVDEKALIAALQGGELRGAALDVFEDEPLPSSSPLYDFPNLLLTPHIAGVSSAYHARGVTAYFAGNLQRYLTGQPLSNVITSRV